MREKVFPWKCSQCREWQVYPDTIEYTTIIEHDGRPYSVKVAALSAPRCKNCSKVVMTEVANQQITEALRQAAGLLTPEEIRAGRVKLGYKQQEFADLLMVGVATVSRWETGAQIQQRSFDQMLRAYFEVPELRRFLEKRHGLESA